MEGLQNDRVSEAEESTETERVVAKVVVLPTGSAIGDNEISGICQVIRLATANGRLLRDQLSAGSKVAAAR